MGGKLAKSRENTSLGRRHDIGGWDIWLWRRWFSSTPLELNVWSWGGEITGFCKSLHTPWSDCLLFEPDGSCPCPTSMTSSQVFVTTKFPKILSLIGFCLCLNYPWCFWVSGCWKRFLVSMTGKTRIFQTRIWDLERSNILSEVRQIINDRAWIWS